MGNRSTDPNAGPAKTYDDVNVVDPRTGHPMGQVFDTSGGALPANFEGLPYASNTTWGTDGFPTLKVEVVTASGATYTKTTIYTANGSNPPNKADAGWVKS